MKLSKQLKSLLKSRRFDAEIIKRYRSRLREGRLTRDENPISHVCVYFAAFDPERKEVFIGHHKKSNLWLFTGGHIDKGELIEESVSREIWEEWGQRIAPADIPQPSFLTITRWMKSTSCKTHFDIWHFFPVNKKRFFVDQSKIAEEFHEIRWGKIKAVAQKIKDPATLDAVSIMKSF